MRMFAWQSQLTQVCRIDTSDFCSGSISVWGGWLQNLSSCAPSIFQNVVERPEDAGPGQTLVLRTGGGSSVLSRHDLRGHDLGSGARSPLHL
jgi:hypothetical protein